MPRCLGSKSPSGLPACTPRVLRSCCCGSFSAWLPPSDCVATPVRCEPDRRQPRLRNLAAQWRLRAVPILAEAERVAVPTVVGLLKPFILVPTSAITGLASTELELILAHELAHVRRHDMWVNLLQRLGEVVLFFNPALWYLSRRIAALREYCCDEYVCNQQSARTVDARATTRPRSVRIVELAKPASNKRARLVALAANGSTPSELRRRVAQLFGEPMNEPLRVSRGGLIAAAVLGFLILAGPGMLRTNAETNDDKQADADKAITAAAQFPPPATEADRIVAAARARTFGLQNAPRVLLRQSVWSADVPAMKKVPEQSLAMLWKARGDAVEETERRSAPAATALAWDVPKLLLQTDIQMKDDATSQVEVYPSSRYWDGADAWLSESSPANGHNIYRYATLKELDDQVTHVYYPQFIAAGGRLTWSGPEVLLWEYEVDPQLTRYQAAGTETIDGVECDIYDGPARHERLWIEKPTGFIKAVCAYDVHEDVPNYFTERVREVAGRTFTTPSEYGEWKKSQSPELQAKLSAFWGAAHWTVSVPSALSVFKNYREVVPGVHFPMLCERVVVLPNGNKKSKGYRYMRGEVAVTDFTEKFSMADLAKETLPQVGDKVTDRRFDPQIEYSWKDSLERDELKALHQKKLDERRQAEDKKRGINATPINSVADAIHILTDGPKVDPADIWIRAIKYLVEHKDESLPVVIKQLDVETRDHAISKLAFALRAIGDKRAVPALIRALPKTLLPSRSDFGVEVEDPELVRFAQQHDQTGKVRGLRDYVNYGRAFREVTSALHRLTGKDFGEMELNWVHLAESPASVPSSGPNSSSSRSAGPNGGKPKAKRRSMIRPTRRSPFPLLSPSRRNSLAAINRRPEPA